MNFDASSGGYAPATIRGIPYLLDLDVIARLGTQFGRQIMRPSYGLDLSPLVDRKNIVPTDVRRALNDATRGLPARVTARATQTGVEVDSIIEIST